MKKNDTYNLKKDAWYLWLLKYTLGLDYNDFSYVCPLFWVTVLAVLISPITLPLCFIIDMVKKVIQRYNDANDEEFRIWADMYYHDISVNPATYEALKNSDFYSEKNKQMYRFVYSYLRDVNYDMFEELWQIGYKKSNKLEEEKWVKKARNKRRINNILKYIIPIGKGLVYLGLGVLCGIVIHLLIMLIIALSHFTSSDWIKLIWVSLITVCCGAVIFIISIIVENSGKKTKAVFSKIGHTFLWPFLKIIQAFKFIITIISDYCPAIKWS